MRERPILFSGPMVRAILEGRKTVTRRLACPLVGHGSTMTDLGGGLWRWAMPDLEVLDIRCPYGIPGDRLWVRETWTKRDDEWVVAYRADGECGAWSEDGGGGRIWVRHGGVIGPEWNRPESWRGQSFGLAHFGGRWRPSIHMPRWASRLTLEVVSVRVERLQDITEEDAIAEGCCGDWTDRGLTIGWEVSSAVEEFAHLWDEINGKRAPWSLNPWVWRIEFRTTTEGR